MRRFFSLLFGGSRTGTNSGPGYGSGSAGVVGSARQDDSIPRTRQHHRPEYTVDDEDTPPEVSTEWRKGRSEQVHMTSLAYRGTSNERRKSDEKRIISLTHTRTDHSQGSIESVDLARGDRVSGITKMVEVQVTSRPSSLHPG